MTIAANGRKRIMFELFWGVLHKPISEQLKEQGLAVNKKKMEKYDKWKVSINQLYIANLITDSENTKIIKRAMNIISKDLKEIELS